MDLNFLDFKLIIPLGHTGTVQLRLKIQSLSAHPHADGWRDDEGRFIVHKTFAKHLIDIDYQLDILLNSKR